MRGIVSGGERKERYLSRIGTMRKWIISQEYFISQILNIRFPHVNERKLDMVYEPFDIQLTEY